MATRFIAVFYLIATWTADSPHTTAEFPRGRPATPDAAMVAEVVEAADVSAGVRVIEITGPHTRAFSLRDAAQPILELGSPSSLHLGIPKK